MKKILYFVVMAGLIISCKNQKQSPPNLNEAKSNLENTLNSYDSALVSKDANAITAFYTNDILYCGTDPKEFFNKEAMAKNIRERPSVDSLLKNTTVSRRDIRVSKDGNSAIAIEQIEFPAYLPVRLVYHAVKDNNKWMFDFISVAFIPNNEDIPKLNQALTSQSN